MLVTSLVVLSLIANECGDELPKNAPLKIAQWQKAAEALPLEELRSIIEFPDKIEDYVSILVDRTDLKIFAVASHDLSRWEFIDVWGYDVNPIHLAHLEIAPLVKDTRVSRILYADSRLSAVLKALPKLEDLLSKYELLNQTTLDFKTERGKLVRRFLKMKVEVLEERVLSWTEIYDELYQKASRPRKKIPQQAREAVFVGWIQPRSDGQISKNQASIKLTKSSDGKEKIYVSLNKDFQRLEHFGYQFQTLDDRIKHRQSFDLNWLKLTDPIVLEIEWKPEAPSEELPEIRDLIVLKSMEDLPEGIRYYRIDSKSLQRISTLN